MIRTEDLERKGQQGVSFKILHCQDGSHQVQRGNENPQLSYQGGQQQGPGRLAVSFPMAKHLPHKHTDKGRESNVNRCTLFTGRFLKITR